MLTSNPPNDAPVRSGAEVVLSALRRHGVELIFGQSIPSPLFQAAPAFGIRQIGYRTENAAGTMADGYARVSGKVGVVAAQNGPAATLLVPPLAEAIKASIPVVALVQEIARGHSDKNAFQEFDHFELFKSCAKLVRRIDHTDRIEDYIDMAFAAAVSGRPGPVVLLLPMDMLREKTQVLDTRTRSLGCHPGIRSVPTQAQLREAIQALLSADRPLIIAGGGVHLSGAAEVLADFQEKLGIPVATTNMGKGAVSELHPLSVGVVGNCMSELSPAHGMQEYVKQADIIFLIGTRTNQNGTDSWRLYPRAARYIHLDVDPGEIGRNYEATPLVGDAKETIKAMHELILDRNLEKRKATRSRFESLISTSRANWRRAMALRLDVQSGPLRPEVVVQELDRALKGDFIITTDASYSTNWVATYVPARTAGSRFIFPRGLAGLGWGLPLALGAKIAEPGSRIVAVVGDGGFAHCWAELEAASRQGIQVTVIVLNNGVLGYQKHAEDQEYGQGSDACMFSTVDHAKIAESCGCLGIKVTEKAQLAAAFEKAFSSRVPSLIDAYVDPDARPPLSLFEKRRVVAA